MLDDALGLFRQSAAQWKQTIEKAAMYIFWTLGTISLVITYGTMLVRKADIGEFFAETIRFMLFFGFFLWLLQNGPAFANDIVNSLRTLGDTASGSYGGTSPSRVIDVGLKVVAKTAKAGSWWEPGIWLGAWIVALISLILLTLVGLNLFMLYAASYIVLYAGFFVLGFGGSRWTSDIAINYYKSVLAIALKLMTMILLISLCGGLIEKYFNAMPGKIDLVQHNSFLIFCLTFFVISHTVPDMVAGMVSGGAAGVGSTSGGAMFRATQTAMTAAAAAGGAAIGAAAAAGGAALGGAAALTGAAQGIAEAFKSGMSGADSSGDSSMYDTAVPQPPPPAKTAQAAASGGGGSTGSSNSSGASGSTSGGGAQGSSGSTGAQGAQGSSSSSASDTGGGGQQGASSSSGSNASSASDSAPTSSGDEAASDDSSQNTDLAQSQTADTGAQSDAADSSGGEQQGANGSSDSNSKSSAPKHGLSAIGSAIGGAVKDTASGAMEGAKQAASKGKTAWERRVDNSIGGKFRDRVKAAKAGVPYSNPSGGETFRANTLQETKVDRQAEVDAFVNKHKS